MLLFHYYLMKGDDMQAATNLTVKLDYDERTRLKALADAKKRTPHFLMKEAIARYIADEEAEQMAVKIASASIEHYKQTGLHVTLDEVKAWANAVKSNRNAKLTPCHE